MGRKPKRIANKGKTGEAAARQAAILEPAPPYRPGEAAFFALTLFLSAALLFTVQPMFAKMVLPHLGGAPAVWNACLVFYQAALLGGYLYAHLSLKWLGPRRQAVLQLGLLAVAWVSLPIHVADDWIPPATTFPIQSLWMLLAVALGLPFFAISANAPMLQVWFAVGKRGQSPFAGTARRVLCTNGDCPRFPTRDPYFLYAASNLGSLLGLLGYPLLMEAHLTLAKQSLTWAVGFGLLTALIAACAVRLWKTPVVDVADAALLHETPSPPAPLSKGEGKTLPSPPAAGRRLRWLALALVPSSLLMGVTTYITSEITQMPFLWIIPLAIYLLTFVFVFAPRTVLPLKWMLAVQPVLLVLAAASLLFNVAGLWEMLLFGSLHLIVFFVTAMVCHGLLAADRPEPARLTEFYLLMSLGGVIGGLFSTLVAPLIFHRALEYPLMMAAACMLRPRTHVSRAVCPSDPEWPARGRWLERRDILPLAALPFCLAVAWGLRSEAFISAMHISEGFVMRLAVIALAAAAALMLVRRPVVFGIAVAAVAAIGLWSVQAGLHVLHAERSFFGILRVEYDELWNTHQLLHGATTHGVQSQYADQRREPQGYYHRSGPLGNVFVALSRNRKKGTVPISRNGPEGASQKWGLSPFSWEVGILGLGAGGIAAYAEPGERFTFYEIDPAVQRIARNPKYFTYLSDCRGETDVILGDARLMLQYGPARQYDLLVLDVFSSDFVPVHLMTREALQLYRRRLNRHGVLVFHISSRYFNLEPVLGRLAADAGLTARVWHDNHPTLEKMVGWFPSDWLVMAENQDDLGALARADYWTAPTCDPGPPWTDEFSNIAGTLHWQSGLHLMPPRWLSAGKADRAAAHAALGSALLQERRFEDAVDQFQKSLELEPGSAPMHYALAAALAALGKTGEAAGEYEEALGLDPDNALYHRDLGVAYGKLGKLDKAVAEFRQAIALDPSDANVFINLGNIFLGRKESQEAQHYYRQGIAYHPDSAELHDGLGRALMQQGKVRPEALGEFRRALPLAEQANNAALAEKIRAAIRRCDAWPPEKKQ